MAGSWQGTIIAPFISVDYAASCRSLSQGPYRFRIGSYRLVPGLPDLLLAVADRLHFGSRLICMTLAPNAEPGLHPGSSGTSGPIGGSITPLQIDALRWAFHSREKSSLIKYIYRSHANIVSLFFAGAGETARQRKQTCYLQETLEPNCRRDRCYSCCSSPLFIPFSFYWISKSEPTTILWKMVQLAANLVLALMLTVVSADRTASPDATVATRLRAFECRCGVSQFLSMPHANITSPSEAVGCHSYSALPARPLSTW